MMPLLIILIIVVTIFNIILVNSFVTYIYDEFGDYADPEWGRAFLRICLVPPIGILVTAVCTICICIAWIIMIVLDIWDR